MGKMTEALALLKDGIESQGRFLSYINEQSGQKATVTTDLRMSTPPCVLLSFAEGEIESPMQTGSAVFRVRCVFPLFGDATMTALEALGLLIEDMYHSAARSVGGVRMGFPLVINSLQEMEENPGMWDALVSVRFDF